MKRPARSARLLGEAEYRDEAEPLLKTAGDAVLVRRGVLRSMLMRCPDGCGQTIVVNLDPRAGKAWRLDMRRGELTLFPSVWREGGCGSHFVLWRGKILWFDRFEDDNVEPSHDPDVESRMLQALLPNQLRSAEDIASELDELPWEIIRTGHILVRRGLAISGGRAQRDWFALV